MITDVNISESKSFSHEKNDIYLSNTFILKMFRGRDGIGEGDF